jgi:hypothetical protein
MKTRRVTYLLVVVCLFVAHPVAADSSGLDALRANIQQRLKQYDTSEANAKNALAEGKRVAARARSINDAGALAVAEQAVAKAERTLADVRAARQRDRELLAACDKAAKNSLILYASGLSATFPGHHEGTVTRSGSKALDAPFEVGDELTTGADGRIEIYFTSGDRYIVGPHAHLKITAGPEGGALSMLKGRFMFQLNCAKRGHRCPSMRTPTVAVAVRGTVYDVNIDDKGTTRVIVLQGVVDIKGKNGDTIAVETGHEILIDNKGMAAGPKPFDAGAYERWWKF